MPRKRLVRVRLSAEQRAKLSVPSFELPMPPDIVWIARKFPGDGKPDFRLTLDPAKEKLLRDKRTFYRDFF